MVAGAIIGVLASSLAFVLNPIEQFAKSHDAQRKDNLSQIATALDTYYNDNNSSPADLTQIEGVYMPKLPKDPLVAQSYCYESDGSSFRLSAKLERNSDPQAIPNIICKSNSYNYSITSTNTSVVAFGAPTPTGIPTLTPAPTTPTPTLVPTSTPTPTPVPCQVTTAPASQTLVIGGTSTVTASVTSGLGVATVNQMRFGSYNTAIATVNPTFDSSSPYSTTATAVATGLTAVWGTADLNDGRTCPSTGATDTDITVVVPTPTPTATPIPTNTPTPTPTPTSPFAFSNSTVSPQSCVNGPIYWTPNYNVDITNNNAVSATHTITFWQQWQRDGQPMSSPYTITSFSLTLGPGESYHYNWLVNIMTDCNPLIFLSTTYYYWVSDAANNSTKAELYRSGS